MFHFSENIKPFSISPMIKNPQFFWFSAWFLSSCYGDRTDALWQAIWLLRANIPSMEEMKIMLISQTATIFWNHLSFMFGTTQDWRVLFRGTFHTHNIAVYENCTIWTTLKTSCSLKFVLIFGGVGGAVSSLAVSLRFVLLSCHCQVLYFKFLSFKFTLKEPEYRLTTVFFEQYCIPC